MSIRSLYRLCPPWTRFRRRRKLWKKVVYSWERVWLLVYRFVFFLRDATWNGSLPLWTETRLNLRGMLLFDNETPSWFSTQPSLFLLSFFLFFFYDTHFSLQDSRKKHAPLNAFNIPSSFPKNLGKNLAKFSKEFRQGFLCILCINLNSIHRSVGEDRINLRGAPMRATVHKSSHLLLRFSKYAALLLFLLLLLLVNGGGRRRFKLDHDVTHNKLMATKIK